MNKVQNENAPKRRIAFAQSVVSQQKLKQIELMKKRIFIYLFDGYSDWEIAYLAPELNKSENHELIYVCLLYTSPSPRD